MVEHEKTLPPVREQREVNVTAQLNIFSITMCLFLLKLQTKTNTSFLKPGNSYKKKT